MTALAQTIWPSGLLGILLLVMVVLTIVYLIRRL